MERATASVLTIATAIIGVAIIAVIVSKKSSTVSVLETAFAGFNNILKTAVSPITG